MLHHISTKQGNISIYITITPAGKLNILSEIKEFLKVGLN
jgi:hypothetical protein